MTAAALDKRGRKIGIIQPNKRLVDKVFWIITILLQKKPGRIETQSAVVSITYRLRMGMITA